MPNTNWATASLGECISSANAGVSVNSEDHPYGLGEIGVLKTSAVSGGHFLPSENKAVLARDRSRVAEPLLANSVLFSRMNTPLLVGESCYVESGDSALFLPDRLWQIRVESSLVNARWLSHVLQAPHVSASLKALATGTSGSMKNISKSSLLAFRIQLPPLGEQARIAEILDAIEQQRCVTQKLIEKFKDVRLGIANTLFATSLRDGSSERAVHTVGELFELQLGKMLDSGRGQMGRELPYLTNRNVQWRQIVLTDLERMTFTQLDERRFRLRDGDVLMCEGGEIGRCAVWTFGDHDIYFQKAIHRLRPRPQIDPFYFVDLFDWMLRQGQIAGLVGQTSIAHLPAEKLAQIRISVPPLGDQRRAIDILTAVDLRIESEARSALKLQSIKEGVASDLLTGRVRVPAEVAL